MEQSPHWGLVLKVCRNYGDLGCDGMVIARVDESGNVMEGDIADARDAYLLPDTATEAEK